MKRVRFCYSSALFAVVTLVLRPLMGCAESITASDLPDASAPPTSQLPVDGGVVDASAPVEDASARPTDAGPCSASGFCLEPIAVQQPLLAVSGTSMDDAWAVAPDGLLRWEGTSWRKTYQYDEMQFGEGTLFGLSATKHDDVWALGTRVLVRYSAREEGGAPDFREYRITSSHKDALRKDTASYWVNPTSNEIWVFNGYTATTANRYRDEPGGTLVREPISASPIGFPWIQNDAAFLVRSIFGFASDDIYVGGAWCTSRCSASDPAWYTFDGALAHYDGSSWSIVANFAKGKTVLAINGTSADDGTRRLWIMTGQEGAPTTYSLNLLALPEDGGAPKSMFTQPMGATPGSVPLPSTAWFSDGAFVYRWNGTGLDLMSTAVNGLPVGRTNGLWAANENEAWIVGEALRKNANDAPRGFAARRTWSAP